MSVRRTLVSRRIKACGMALMTAILLGGCKNHPDEVHKDSLFAMDTYMTFTVYGSHGQEAIQMAKSEIQRLDSLLSTGDENSAVSELNAKKELTLCEELTALWETSLELSRQTEGAFDVTIYPLMKAWGFAGGEYRVPSDRELETLLSQVGSEKVSWDAEHKSLRLAESMELDFGGIAKGYAGERVAELLKQNGVESALLDLGGNIQLIGSKPDGSDFRIGVKHPLNENQVLGTLSASDVAIVTSGGYERYFEESGTRYHHILDPSTGHPADAGLLSVTIVCDSGRMADAYSTALYVLGEEKAIRFWREHAESFEAVLFTESGKLYVTEGLENAFVSDDEVTILRAIP